MKPDKRAIEQHAKACFLNACTLDVAVRKPGNVSLQSPGHGMQAQMFLDSAQAAAGPLFERGAGVGERVEAAVDATLAVAGCNTNLGILLLCAPLAVAMERLADAAEEAPTVPTLRRAVQWVLEGLSLDDARAAYRAIALANPGGLGSAPAEDVHAAPSIDLRAAMALAAGHDLIARQYRDGYAGLFDVALPALGAGFAVGAGLRYLRPSGPVSASVQRLFLVLLSTWPDSHIVRKHGEAVAQTVMTSAQGWRVRAEAGDVLDTAADFHAWDESLKLRGINPGTSADLTVATLMMAGLTRMENRHGAA